MVNIFDIFILWLALFTISALHFRLNRELLVEETRERIFKVRDRLFLDFADLEVDHSNQAYVLTRRMANGMIRFCHRLSLSQLILFVLFGRQEDAAARSKEHFEAVAELDDDSKRVVLKAVSQLHIIALSHIVERSVLLKYIIIPAFKHLTYLRKLGGIWRKKFKKILDREALVAGDDEGLGTGGPTNHATA